MRFENLIWIKGETYFEQGHKNGHIPHNAIAGGNGSFIIAEPARLYLVCDGGFFLDIMRLVRRVNGWSRMTERRFLNLEKRFKEVKEFKEDEIEDIVRIT